jgi:hypothetical protein
VAVSDENAHDVLSLKSVLLGPFLGPVLEAHPLSRGVVVASRNFRQLDQQITGRLGIDERDARASMAGPRRFVD